MTGTLNRRRFGTGLAALAAAAVTSPAISRSRARVVVIGGGPGGATVAGQLKKSAARLEVILLEPKRHYTTCFFSNHYIGGLRTLASITHDYNGLRRAGVDVVHRAASGIDPERKRVRLARGSRLSYDRLVVAPGIDFKFGAIEGYDEAAAEIMPHAWTAGPQSQLLRRKLEAMDDGGVVVMAPPRNPFRCPPGPYERACAIAHYLRKAKPRSKLIIFDPKMAFSKQAVFEEAFRTLYKDVIELHLTDDIDDMAIARVDTRTGEVTTKSGTTVKAAVANIIPDQRAGDIAHRAGLADGDWCPVLVESFRSAKADGVYVLGDASLAQDMPKSAYSANNQARVVAADILADLAGSARPAARFRNTCWSMIAPGNGVKIGADYAPGDLAGKHALVPSGSFISAPGESAALRLETYEESEAWYDTLVADVFAK